MGWCRCGASLSLWAVQTWSEPEADGQWASLILRVVQMWGEHESVGMVQMWGEPVGWCRRGVCRMVYTVHQPSIEI